MNECGMMEQTPTGSDFGDKTLDFGTTKMTGLAALNAIRANSLMPNIESGLSQEEYREIIRRERRVELAFEGHLFWDMRRWELNEANTITGVDITLAADGSKSYKLKELETRVWDDRMNLYPIPQTELMTNSNLVQNSGW